MQHLIFIILQSQLLLTASTFLDIHFMLFSAVLLVILIAIAVIYMLIRYKRKQHPIPTRMRNTMIDLRRSFRRAPPSYDESLHDRVANDYVVQEAGGAVGPALKAAVSKNSIQTTLKYKITRT